LIIIEEKRFFMAKKMSPIHPGEILKEEFLIPLNISQNQLGRDLGVSPRRVNEIILGKRSITADTALRLAKYFKMSPEFWMNLQVDHDLEMTSDRLSRKIDLEVKTCASARAI
jgi:antitoxin HigA-1